MSNRQIWAATVLISLSFSLSALAQTEPRAEADAAEGIRLNLPDNVELHVLVDYVSQRLNEPILYDEQVANKRLTVQSPSPVPEAALLALLESALQMKGLALVESSSGQWKRIVPAAQLSSVAPSPSRSQRVSGATQAITRVYRLEHTGPAKLEQILKPFLTQPGGNSISVPEQRVLVVTDVLANVDRLDELVELADRPGPETSTVFFPLKHATASDLASQAQQILQSQIKASGLADAGASPPTVIAEPRSNQLVAIGRPEMITPLHQIIDNIDVPLTENQQPVRFYKLSNRTAAEVLETLRSLEGDKGLALLSAEKDLPGADPEDVAETGSDPVPFEAADEPGQWHHSLLSSGKAKVVADEHTNSLIVVGPPRVQQVYEYLITVLDQRRPQVLLEATLVIIDTSENFSLGVEISGNSDAGDAQVITFSSFGLSEVNPDTGRLSLTPGLGFNGAVLSSEIADVVIQALKRNARAKVISAPRILVNDNATGILSSTQQQPYESVNASDTVATTSFGGFVEAGTTISLTPHISKDDYIQLEYAVELSSFTGDRVDNLPPPRNQNQVESQVTVPDGSTIIVGGLNRRDESKSKQAVPLLGELPILEYLLGAHQVDATETTLFVFVRPVVLRSDRFEDLKYLSRGSREAAEVEDDFPPSQPMLMR